MTARPAAGPAARPAARPALAALAALALAAPALAQDAPAPATDAPADAPQADAPAAPAESPADTPTEPLTDQGVGPVDGFPSQGGTGALVNFEGAQLGNVSVETVPSGHALVLGNANGFPEGVFGVHLHEVGRCDGPDFESAGDHIAGDREHGIRSPNGPHPGDLPNIYVGTDGVLAFDAFAIGLTADLVFDEDGSALIVHASPDDYATQPHGHAGDRIACAVIEPAPHTPAAEEAGQTDAAQPANETATGSPAGTQEGTQDGAAAPAGTATEAPADGG
jgi:Cu-Zn family superoxide dismutase